MAWHLPLLALVTLACATAVWALPQLPEGADPAAYYGGFYPTEEWIAGLEPLPREQREGPFQRVVLVAEPPEGRDAWPGAVIRLTPDGLAAMRERMAPYMAVAPRDLLGMVPRRNRIAGNARVMPGRGAPPCPTGDGGRLAWTPDRPDEIRCSEGHALDPYALFPPTGAFEITGPLGETQSYPYHDALDGRRTFVQAEFMDALRVSELSRAAWELAVLHAVDGDDAPARRAAAIIYDFARAVPHWPKIHRGRPTVEGIYRFRPVDEITVYAGIWYDKYHTGVNREPRDLALALDLIARADVWHELDADAPGGDARETIDRDLFLYTACDAIRYDVRYPEPHAALSNYIPYQIAGFTAIGRAAGMPELVHYAAWKARQLAEKTLMADGVFPESPSYARQHIYGLAKALLLSVGHTDPPGFISTIDGGRFDSLDMARDLPHLDRAITVLESMVYPDNSYIMVHDTWSSLVSSGHPAPAETTPLIYPSFGHAALARGRRERGDQIQAHLHYSGSWGHDHRDMLGFILWAGGGERVSDIGYAHTYRLFADWSLGHNLVVVDRRYQQQVPDHGTLIAWHPAAEALQVVEAQSGSVYPQCSVYRRALLLVPLNESDSVVVDIFTVQGGSTHEWMAQGSAMLDQHLEVSLPIEHFAESYADDGRPFEPPAHNEYTKLRVEQGLPPSRLAEGEPDPWYGVFRDVRRGRLEAPMLATFSTEGDAPPPLHLHILQPGEADVYTCTVPSLRRCWSEATGGEDHRLVERFRMPKLIVRRDGTDLHSRFVAVWEPTRGERALAQVSDLAPDRADVVAISLRAADGAGVEAEVYYAPDPSAPVQLRDGVRLDGRYAAVVRSGGWTDVFLYDCRSFSMPGLEVEIASRPPLPLLGIIPRAGGEYALELDGVWQHGPDAVALAAPDQALVQIGNGQRVVPISGMEVVGERTRLLCPRHPGFRYDAERGVLTDEFSPWLEYQGVATVSMGSRAHLRGDGGGWQVTSSDRVTVHAGG